MSIEAILTTILAKLPGRSKPRRTFLAHYLTLLLARQGRLNFTNMARFSHRCEKTFRRHADRFVDWLSLNQACLEQLEGEWIGVFDGSFIPRSGEATFGLDTFWSSCHHKAQRGLEISVLAAINTATKCCLALEVSQTPARLPTADPKAKTQPRPQPRPRPTPG